MQIRTARISARCCAAGHTGPKAYLYAGWWFGCNHCGARCDSDASYRDEETETDIALDLVFDGRVAYCLTECKAGHEAEDDARNTKFEEFKIRVAAEHPGATFTEFTGGYPWCGNKGLVTFSGAQYGGKAQS